MFIAARISYIRGHMFTGKYVHQYGGQLKWDHLTENDLYMIQNFNQPPWLWSKTRDYEFDG